MNKMQVTNVRVTKFKAPTGSLLGFAQVTLDDMIVINGIKVMNGKNGISLYFPTKPRKQKGEKAYFYAFPIKQEARVLITEAVVKEF